MKEQIPLRFYLVLLLLKNVETFPHWILHTFQTEVLVGVINPWQNYSCLNDLKPGEGQEQKWAFE